jgi:chitodextrinase
MFVMFKKIVSVSLLLVAIIGLTPQMIHAAPGVSVLPAEQNGIREKITLLTKQLQLLQLQLVQSTTVSSTSVAKTPLYPSSVVGTDFDYITDADPNAFQCLEYVGYKPFEMPDKTSDTAPLVQDAFVFNAHFSDGTSVGIALDKDFGSRGVAEADAMRYTSRLGKFPTLYRSNLNHIVVHKGGVDTTAFAEDKGHFFVIYSDNATKRIGTHDLEETFFHEGTHATIQDSYIRTTAWQNAKAADNAYITNYAGSEDQEDFAESALFAYTLIHNPERFPVTDRVNIETTIPNRIAFFRTIYTSPRTYSVGPVNAACLPKDTTAPSAPTGLSGSEASRNQIKLTWKASTDAVGVTNYLIERCQGASCTSFSQIGTASSTTYTTSGLAATTDYRFRVRATDAAGNRSAYSTVINYTTSQSVTPSPETVTVFLDTFESSLNWTKKGDVARHTGTPKVGSYSVQLKATSSIEKTISLSGYKNAKVSFKMGAHSLDNKKENLQAHYYNGSAWVLLAEIINDSANENNKLNTYTFSLPTSLNGQSKFKLRFTLNGSGVEDYGYVDDVKVTGTK